MNSLIESKHFVSVQALAASILLKHCDKAIGEKTIDGLSYDIAHEFV